MNEIFHKTWQRYKKRTYSLSCAAEITNICYFCKQNGRYASRCYTGVYMARARFDFKQFAIYHDKCAMKVGTDGVLLGAWTEVGPHFRRILDVGTGSGLIAIMLAQRCDAHVTGIDIDEESVGQAVENGRATPWSQRLHFEVGDALSYVPAEKFDLITCNPPFFPDSPGSPGGRRGLARHSSALPPGALLSNACAWLEEGGHFSVILPASSADAFIQEAWERGFGLRAKCMVYGSPGSRPKRALLGFKKGNAPYPPTARLLIADKNGNYTEEYKRLTGEYYIRFPS